MILVTGASGTVGRALAESLANRASVRLALHDPAKAPAGSDAVAFDFTRPTTFIPALDGVEAVFLMRPPQIARVQAFEPFLDAMAMRGIRRVVLLSVKGAERNPLLPHHAIERRLAKSGVPATVLRPSDFLQNFATVHAAAIRASDEIRLPAGRGKSACVDARDVADAAADALLDMRAGNRAHTLTGPTAIGVDTVAAAISEATGRQIRYVPISLARFLAERVRAGAPTPLALVMAAIYTVQRAGLAAEVTDDLPRLLGRPGRDVATFARDYAAAWTS